MKPRYEVLRRGTTFTAFGPSPETLISKHASLAAARKAFNSLCGNHVLVEVYGSQRTVLDHALI